MWPFRHQSSGPLITIHAEIHNYTDCFWSVCKRSSICFSEFLLLDNYETELRGFGMWANYADRSVGQMIMRMFYFCMIDCVVVLLRLMQIQVMGLRYGERFVR
jgi:hypothetical protein